MAKAYKFNGVLGGKCRRFRAVNKRLSELAIQSNYGNRATLRLNRRLPLLIGYPRAPGESAILDVSHRRN